MAHLSADPTLSSIVAEVFLLSNFHAILLKAFKWDCPKKIVLMAVPRGYLSQCQREQWRALQSADEMSRKWYKQKLHSANLY